MRYFMQLAIAILIVLPMMGCSSSLKVNSQWRDRDIAIDGNHREWSGGMTFFEDDNISLGFFNDAEYLYISMITANPNIQRQFMTMGFTLWFDPDGGKKRTFGIKFPVGMWETGLLMRGRGQRPDLAALRENFEKSLANIELIVPGEEEPLRMRVSEATGIEIKLGDIEERLTYEIRVPLREDENHPYAIAAKPDKAIGVGFETAQIDREKMRQQMSGRPGMGGGMGGGRGGSGGGRGGSGGGRGSMGGGRPQMPEQFKLWVTLQPSTGNQPSDLVNKNGTR